MITVEELIPKLDAIEDELEKDLRTAVITHGLGKTQDDFRAEYDQKLQALYDWAKENGYKGSVETFVNLNHVKFENHSEYWISILPSSSSAIVFDLRPEQQSFYRFREIHEAYHPFKRIWYKKNGEVGLTKRKNYQRPIHPFPEVQFLNLSFPQSTRSHTGIIPTLSVRLPWLIPTYSKVHIYHPTARYRELIIRKDKDGKFVEERKDLRPQKELDRIEELKIKAHLRHA